MGVGRNPEEITLLPVTKTQPMEVLECAYDLGMRLAGENHVQEIVEKKKHFGERVQFHMIGHLQRNKVRQVLDKVDLIHSVDSLRLAKEIDRIAGEMGIVAHILIEIKVAGEESKYGIRCEELPALLDEVAKLDHIQVEGLMTIAPFVEDPEENRSVFRILHQLFVDNQGNSAHNIRMNVLSMGMTNDYIVAVEEGATLVRVGTGLFGERQYTVAK
ncbi:MAG: YggS family pyridoxal phosphate-dependent enzyme [Firmicutes bacterium]|nr:YggS family pyridoxal phosphate-dependent enzyme [Bacillota bacterium]